MSHLELPGRKTFLIPVGGKLFHLSLGSAFGENFIEGRPAHNHALCELHGVLEGSMLLEVGELKVMLQAGQCCLIRPGEFHRRLPFPSSGKFFDLRIESPFEIFPENCQEDCLILPHAQGILHACRLLAEEQQEERLYGEEARQSLSSLILIDLLRELSAQDVRYTSGASGDNILREEIIDYYLANNYNEDSSAEDLASLLHITSRQLSRIMQNLYGCTFRQRLLETRLYHAKSLLLQTNQPVWQIATACGFSTAGAFCTAFRNAVGKTPTQFRSENK